MVYNGVHKADRPVAPSFGLFSVARVQTRGATRGEYWADGYYVESDTCGLNTKILPKCSTTNEWISAFDNSDGSMYFHVAPFGILQTFECENSIGFNAIDRRATVVRQLDSVSEYAVERELWLGDNAQTDSTDLPAERWLANAIDATPTPGSAVSAEVALALVEQSFAENNPGVRATIHMTPLMATILDGSLEIDGDKLLTKSVGSLVAISRGGLGEEGPGAGGSATRHWIYATGPVHVDLGSDELITTSASEIVNPINNKVAYVAERPAAVYFDGCAWFGVLADATL